MYKKKIIALLLSIAMAAMPMTSFAATVPEIMDSNAVIIEDNIQVDVDESTVTEGSIVTEEDISQTISSEQDLSMSESDKDTINLSDDNIGNTDNYTVKEKTITVKGDVKITGTAVPGTDTDPGWHIVVVGGSESNPVKVTLEGVEINTSAYKVDGDGVAAFELANDANVELTLVDDNILTGGYKHAGLQVEEGNTIKIIGTGSLSATGGDYGAGIGGGNYYGAGGTITIIDNAEVKATGGEYGAGIGGGEYGAGGTITISGEAEVTAQGGDWGAGIGGGYHGAGGTITIDDSAEVKAQGGWGGAGIGSGRFGAGGDVIISGGTIYAVAGEDADAIGAGDAGTDGTNEFTGGSIFTDGDISPAPINDSENKILPYTIEISGLDSDELVSSLKFDNDEYIQEGNTLKTNKYKLNVYIEPITQTTDVRVVVNGNTYVGTLEVGATVVTLYLASTDNTIDLSSVDTNDIYTNYKVDNTSKVITVKGDVKITGTAVPGTDTDPGWHIVVVGGSEGVPVKVKLDNVEIDTSKYQVNNDGVAAFELAYDANVELTLVDDNKLTGGYKHAGLQVEKGNTIEITGSGSLTAQGGEYGAGIGSGRSGAGGDVTISGGVVTAYGNEGAGIGGGYNGSGGNITILGGVVTAYGGSAGAGIGGGNSGAGGNITILGGVVTAYGGWRGAGIGGGDYRAGGDVTISGGTVTANAGKDANDIGGGHLGSAGTNTFTGGSIFTANGDVSPTPINNDGNEVTPYIIEINGLDSDELVSSLKFDNDEYIQEGNTLKTNEYKLNVYIEPITQTTDVRVVIDNDEYIGTLEKDDYEVTLYTPKELTLNIVGVTDGKITSLYIDGRAQEGTPLLITNGIAKTTVSSNPKDINISAVINGDTYTGMLKDPATNVTLYLSESDNSTINLNDKIINSVPNVYEVSGTTITVKDDVTITGTAADPKWHIVVNGGSDNDPVAVTLDNATIDTSKNGVTPIELINNANVELILIGDNNLNGGFESAGLQVEEGNTIEITGTGSLTAVGGEKGAGIGGGGVVREAGKITIGGKVVVEATGGENGSGIGGSNHGSGGEITISGEAVVVATGGENGSGIGGGYSGAGGNVTTVGGTVYAVAGENANAIGAGNKGTVSGNNEFTSGSVFAVGDISSAQSNGQLVYTIQIDGTSLNRKPINSLSIGDNTYFENEEIVLSNTGIIYASISEPTEATDVSAVIYGSTYVGTLLNGDTEVILYLEEEIKITIDGVTSGEITSLYVGNTDYIKEDALSIVGGSVTVTIPKYEGDRKVTAVINGDTYIGVLESGATDVILYIASTDNTIDLNNVDTVGRYTNYEVDDTSKIITVTDDVTIKGTAEAGTETDPGWHIFVDGGIEDDPVEVILKDTTINTSAYVEDDDGVAAFDLANGANVELILEGNNILTSGYKHAGLQVEEGSAIDITSNSSGSLTANGARLGAGIGGGYTGDGWNDYGGNGGTVEINGSADVTAIGGENGAGIGGSNWGNGGTIEIRDDAKVQAIGGSGGAGIGGGAWGWGGGGAGGNITILGGTVYAIAGGEDEILSTNKPNAIGSSNNENVYYDTNTFIGGSIFTIGEISPTPSNEEHPLYTIQIDGTDLEGKIIDSLTIGDNTYFNSESIALSNTSTIYASINELTEATDVSAVIAGDTYIGTLEKGEPTVILYAQKEVTFNIKDVTNGKITSLDIENTDYTMDDELSISNGIAKTIIPIHTKPRVVSAIINGYIYKGMLAGSATTVDLILQTEDITLNIEGVESGEITNLYVEGTDYEYTSGAALIITNNNATTTIPEYEGDRTVSAVIDGYTYSGLLEDDTDTVTLELQKEDIILNIEGIESGEITSLDVENTDYSMEDNLLILNGYTTIIIPKYEGDRTVSAVINGATYVGTLLNGDTEVTLKSEEDNTEAVTLTIDGVKSGEITSLEIENTDYSMEDNLLILNGYITITIPKYEGDRKVTAVINGATYVGTLLNGATEVTLYLQEDDEDDDIDRGNNTIKDRDDDDDDEVETVEIEEELIPEGAVEPDDTTEVTTEDIDFDDVSPDDWYYDDVKEMYNNDLMVGLNDTYFGANEPLSRGTVATVLYRMAGEPDVDFADGMIDVPEDGWFANGISWANEEKVMYGYGEGLFGPNDPITREQLVSMLYRKVDMPGIQSDLSAYSDADKIEAYAKSAFAWAVEEGIVSGYTDGTLLPKATATRAEFASIMARYNRMYD